MTNNLLLLPYLLIAGWLLYSIWLLRKAKNDPISVNYYHAKSIPPVFTTLGVFGTFIGIAIGLYFFDVDNIDGSIPELLAGLQVAFYSSIAGIFLSLIFSRLVQNFSKRLDEATQEHTGEIGALNEIIKQLKIISENSAQTSKRIEELIAGEEKESLSTQFSKLRNRLRDNHISMLQSLDSLNQTLGSDDETSLLTQIQKMRDEQFEISKKSDLSIASIRESMNSNSELFVKKFDEFSELLQKSNTEALVKAIENVIGGFNERLNELLERLVKENFEELNKSVANLNLWQQENKSMIRDLTNQFIEVSSTLESSSKSIERITQSTQELIDEEGRLSKLIEELESVLTDNRLLQESVSKLKESSESLNKSTDTFSESTNSLSKWVENERDFNDTISDLIDSLKEIEELRNQAGDFWSDIKTNMNEGISIIKSGNEALMEDVSNLDSGFNDRMNRSFMSLDKVLQAMVVEYSSRLNNTLENLNQN